MSKGLISFDIDGVLANFTRGFTSVAHKHFGTPVGDVGSQQNWMFEDFPELGLTKKMCDFNNGPIWKEIKSSPTFWRDLDPVNPSVMRRINRIKNRIFITNRFGVDVIDQTHAFLEKWGIYDSLVIAAENKAPVAVEYNVVAHVDDYIKNMTELQLDGPRPLYLALHYLPYNRVWHDNFLNAGYRSDGEKLTKEVTLSVEQFIDNCEARGLVEYAF